MTEWEAQRAEAENGFGFERPDTGDEDDRCKHGNVVYRSGDCDLCDEEDEASEEAAALFTNDELDNINAGFAAVADVLRKRGEEVS